MMWVKLTLPPRARRRWLLMMIRLSAISLAGTARTLVAVGISSEACMLVTTLAGAPRSTVTAASAEAVGATVGLVQAGRLAGAGSAGLLATGVVSAGVAAGAGLASWAGRASWAGLVSSGALC